MFKEFPWLFLLCCLAQLVLESPPQLASFSVAQHSMCSECSPGWDPFVCSTDQAFKDLPSLGSFSVGQPPAQVCGKREATMMAHSLRVTQQYCLASMTALLSSKGIPHCDLPYALSSCLSAVSPRPHPRIALHSPYSSLSCHPFQETCILVWGM